MSQKNQQIKLLVKILLVFTLLLMLPVSEAATPYRYALWCDANTYLNSTTGGAYSTNFTCGTSTTPMKLGLALLNTSAGTSTRIRLASAAVGNWYYARFVNNTPFSTGVNVTGINGSISMYDRSGYGVGGWYEIGYYNPNGTADNFIALFNSTMATTTSTAQASYAISFNNQQGTIPAGNKLAVRVWMNTTTSTADQPGFWSYGTLSSQDSSINVTIDTLIGGTYIPPTPTSLANTTGSYWINHTWGAGSGNVTNLYNVSVNGTWNNGSATAFYNNTNVGISGWSNITVWAYNSTNGGKLSLTSASQNTQAPGAPDTSFTVTLPVNYSQGFFNASLKTQNNVNASGQTLSAGFLNITNTGTATENFLINVTSASPSGATLKAKTNNDPTGATTITTTLVQIITGLGIGASQYVWLWVDYSNAAQMNVQRTMTINSS